MKKLSCIFCDILALGKEKFMRNLLLLPLFCLLFGISATAQKNPDTSLAKSDSLSANRLLSMSPDSNFVSFTISIYNDGQWSQINVLGNKIPENIKTMILKLKPGSKVIYEDITAIDKGILVKLPVRIYIIK
jgi:hypothetical protein